MDFTNRSPEAHPPDRPDQSPVPPALSSNYSDRFQQMMWKPSYYTLVHPSSPSSYPTHAPKPCVRNVDSQRALSALSQPPGENQEGVDSEQPRVASGYPGCYRGMSDRFLFVCLFVYRLLVIKYFRAHIQG